MSERNDEKGRRPIRGYFDLPDETASDIVGQLAAQQERLSRRLAAVRHIFAVMSGKGGVGKSLLTANLAAALADDGLAVGVADADLNGPSAARLLGAKREPLRVAADGVEPGRGAAGVRVMSMDLLLEGDESPVRWTGPRTDSFVWRGTLEANALREFLSDTAWGELDYLILDLPPGAERVAPVRDLVPRLGGVVAVTIPSRLSRFVVAKSLAAARDLDIQIIGYVLNMSGYICPDCGAHGPLFEREEMEFEGVRRLGAVPFDPELGRMSDVGRPYVLERPGSEAARAIRAIAGSLREMLESEAT